MQDFQPLHGSVFCGGGRAELRRIVGYPAVAARQQKQQPPPPAKCPRCDSTNTKFCYYNNYNLSQPRHFCKSCRRYWTMGGVLRNVPVGGGCRKSKRPSSKNPSMPPPESADNDQSGLHPRPSASLCSRDSASISEITTASLLPDPPPIATQISISNPNPNFDPLTDVDPPLRPEPDIFQDPAAGAFTDTPAALLGFGLNDPPPGLEKAEAIRPAFADQTIPVDARPAEGGGAGLAPLDWSGQVEPTLYDLTCAVDPLSYWNQSPWSDADPSLYLP